MSKLRIIREFAATREGRPSVEDVRDGEVFQFIHKIHQSTKRDDIFVRVNTSSSYRGPDFSLHDKIAVVNLTQARISLVSKDREIRKVTATLTLHGVDS